MVFQGYIWINHRQIDLREFSLPLRNSILLFQRISSWITAVEDYLILAATRTTTPPIYTSLQFVYPIHCAEDILRFARLMM